MFLKIKIHFQRGLGRPHRFKQTLCLKEHSILAGTRQTGDDRFLSGNSLPALHGKARAC